MKLDDIITLCNNTHCNAIPWKINGDKPVHLPPKNDLIISDESLSGINNDLIIIQNQKIIQI